MTLLYSIYRKQAGALLGQNQTNLGLLKLQKIMRCSEGWGKVVLFLGDVYVNMYL